MADKRLQILLTAKEVTGPAFNKVTGRIKALTKQVFSLKGAFVTLAGGYGLKQVASSFLDAAKTTENYQIRLQILLGSVEEGNRLFKDMTDYAGRVPFEFQKIMGAATQLSGVMKGGVDEVKQWMPLIGDLAVAAGLGIEKTTEQVIRMYSAGAASADLFRERGINAMLGFQAGVSYTAEQTRQQLMRAWTDPESKFRDATGKMAQSWDGMISMVSDKWFQFRTLVMEAGVFDELKQQLGYLNEEFGKWIKNNDELIKQKVPEYIDDVKDSVKGIVDMYQSLPEDVVGAAGVGVVGRILIGKGSWGLALASIYYGWKKITRLIETLPPELWNPPTLAELDPRNQFQAAMDELDEIVKTVAEKERAVKPKWTIEPPSPDEFLSGWAPGHKFLTAEQLDFKYVIPAEVEMRLGKFREQSDTAWEVYKEREKKRLEEMNKLAMEAYQEEGAMAAEAFEQTMEDANKFVKEWEENLNRPLIELSQRTAEAMERNFSDFYFDAMMGKFKSLEDYAKGVLRSIARATADIMGQQTKEALFGAQGNGGWLKDVGTWALSAITSGGSAGVGQDWGFAPGFEPFHSGGIVGEPRMPTLPRFHSGLGPDEYPAVLQRGEGVFTPGQMKALAPSYGPPSVSVQVNMVNKSGVPLEAKPGEARFDGEQYVVDVTVDRYLRSRSYRQMFQR